MSLGPDLTACAAKVESSDPDRFAAAMASPLAARSVLFALYAFNIEVSRAPWVTQEPMIAEMRLQWWRDALEEIATGQEPRRHEVVTPLSEILSQQDAEMLDKLVAARRWDIYKDAFEDAAHFDNYLQNTGGVLMWVAASSLGAQSDHRGAILRLGYAAGLARYLQAIPDLEEHKRIPLVDGTADAIAQLATGALHEMHRSLRALRGLPKTARPALTEAFVAKAVLHQAAKTPARVGNGTLGPHPLYRSFLLWRWSR